MTTTTEAPVLGYQNPFSTSKIRIITDKAYFHLVEIPSMSIDKQSMEGGIKFRYAAMAGWTPIIYKPEPPFIYLGLANEITAEQQSEMAQGLFGQTLEEVIKSYKYSPDNFFVVQENRD